MPNSKVNETPKPQPKKFCPLFSIASSTSGTFEDCKEWACGFWCCQNEECSLVSITRSIHDIEIEIINREVRKRGY